MLSSTWETIMIITIEAYADGQDHLLIRMNSKKGIVTNIFVVTRMDSANDFQT